MLDKKGMLNKLENCIKVVGREWAEQMDARFISEFSLQVRLLNLLWEDKSLWCQAVSLGEPGLNPVDLPSAYGEWYADSGNADKFDIALLEQPSVDKWAGYTRLQLKNGEWRKLARTLPILAALEVKLEPSWGTWFQEDLNKLKQCIDKRQVEYGYLVMFYFGKNKGFADKRSFLQSNYKNMWGDRNIRVYFSPAPSTSVAPLWIP